MRARASRHHPRDNPRGQATFVGLEHIESGTGVRTGSARAEVDAKTYDLKAVNPNAKDRQDTRTPEELLDLIEAKGREVVLAGTAGLPGPIHGED